MKLIREKTAWYPAFHLGCKPAAVECSIRIVEANGKRYLHTPFAMLNAFADDDIERFIDGRGYFATEAATFDYLRDEYPWADRAELIMDKLCDLRYHLGTLVGTSRAADLFGVSVDEVYKLARGHRSYTLKAVKDALRRLKLTQAPVS
jgi:hypothetical protein